MPTNFTPSVNIIRDTDRNINYIPTPNAVRIVNQISNDFKTGIRSFNIIGSYGTGKSSFLWAYQACLVKNKKYFDINLLTKPTVEFLNIVGEFRSIKEVFADYFEIKNNKHLSENIFSEIYNRYHDLGKKNPILIICIDEFGKFLEYASKNEPEKELFFIQQLAEFANNPDLNILLFTTVHQNFDAYAFSLTQTQKQEWTKVKGRFKEITFNEPVEQLLFLAAEHSSELQSTQKYVKEIKTHISLLTKSRAFNINEDYVNDIAIKLYPLEISAAYILTLSLQKYGQNERSLFSFLEATDHTSLNQHRLLEKGIYSIADVYDFLIFNYYTFLNSRYNPDFSAWKSINIAIEKTEAQFDKNTNDYLKIIKTIGLLNINALAGAVLDKSFLVNYSEKVLKISNASILIENLEKKKIIVYRNYNTRFVLFEGTDLDIQTALIQAGGKLDDVTDVVTLLNKYYQLPPVLAKKVMYETGSPRLFEYKISSQPINDVPNGEIDGFINLIFNPKLKSSAIQQHSLENKEAILYCYYKNSSSIKDLLFEIEKTKKVITENEEDKVAIRELNNIMLHQQNLLNHKILNNFYSPKSDVVWFFKGETFELKNKKEFNSKLSEICDTIYNKTPIFRNELVNKHKISSSIHTAKKNYFRALVNNWDESGLGFQEDKFPPEKTIYLSLLENNNIKLFSNDINYEIKPSTKNKFNTIWEISNKFLNASKVSKRNLSEFIDILSIRPFKIKQGFIDFWVPTFLFIKRDDFALFGPQGYVPTINDEVLELIVKNPEEYQIKTFAVNGVKLNIFNKYRNFLNQENKQKLSNKTFIETIKPFLIFYKDLPEYTKNTKRLSKEAINIRSSIALSKDPEHTFFEEFPNALGYSLSQIENTQKDLQSFTLKLQSSIRELRNCYDELILRVESFITEEFIGEKADFEEYQIQLQNRYKKLRSHLLLTDQKVFFQRLNSKIEDNKAWLNSLTQSLLNTPLTNITDEQEILLYDKFKAMIVSLDSLTKLSKTDYSEDKEEIYDLQINSFIDGMQKKIVRMPKSKKVEIDKIQSILVSKLSKDNMINIAALTNLLKELLKK